MKIRFTRVVKLGLLLCTLFTSMNLHAAEPADSLMQAMATTTPVSVTYTYDSLGRLARIKYPDNTTDDYSYDAAGNRTSEVVNVVYAPVTATLSQSPTATVAGTPYTITWGSSNAVSCIVDYSRNGEVPLLYTTTLNGSASISPAVVVGTHVWRNTCTGAGGDVSQATFAHTVYAPVTATLSQSPTATVAGTPYTITWGSSNAVSCIVDYSRNGEVPLLYTTTLNGSASISPAVVVGTHVWRNTCTGAGGDVSQATFAHTVYAPVTATLSQSPTATVAGTPYTITWGSSNAVSCIVDYSRNGEVPLLYTTTLNGSASISPAVVVGTHVWRNTCTGAGGDVSRATFAHTVYAPVTATLSQSPTATVAGTPYTITWGSSNAVSCIVDYSRNGEVPLLYTTTLNGSASISPAVVVGTHVWRNTCTGAGGDVSRATFAHTVYAPVTATLSQSPTATVAGTPYTITWGSSNAVSCTVDYSRNGEVPLLYTTTLSGSASISPAVVVGTHVWRNTCTGAGGDVSQATFAHTVYAPVTATLSQSPTSTVSGTPYTITWGSSNAVSCRVDYSRNGEVPLLYTTTLSGSASISPAVVVGTHVWRNTCTGAGGDVSQATFAHTVTAPVTAKTLSQSLTASVTDTPPYTITWGASNAASCKVPVPYTTTRIANNVIYILNDSQFSQLKALAIAQIDQINLYGYKRFPLMQAFHRLLDGDIPAGSTGLNLNAVQKAFRELYLIDGQISFDRALLYAKILNSMNSTQEAYLDAMKGQGEDSWPDITNDQIQSKMKGLPQDTAAAVMTYASDLFSWYAGSVEADVYFCPERHGTYYGSFYIKDAPAGYYSIDEQLTATAGDALSDSSKVYVTQTQAALMSSLVVKQKDNLNASAFSNIVQVRTEIAMLLRSLLITTSSSDTIKAQVLELSDIYGNLDGENNYAYATAFAQVYQTLISAQKDKLSALRKSIMSGTYADGTPFDYSVTTTPFFYSDVITDVSLIEPYIADTDYLFFEP